MKNIIILLVIALISCSCSTSHQPKAPIYIEESHNGMTYGIWYNDNAISVVNITKDELEISNLNIIKDNEVKKLLQQSTKNTNRSKYFKFTLFDSKIKW